VEAKSSEFVREVQDISREGECIGCKVSVCRAEWDIKEFVSFVCPRLEVAGVLCF